MISDRVIEQYRRYGWTDTEGEWGYIQSDTRREYHGILEAGASGVLDVLFAHMFRSPICAGLVSVDFRDAETPEGREAIQNAVTANLVLWHDYTGETDVSILAVPSSYGQPLEVECQGRSILPDTPRHDRYAHRMVSLGCETVVEIGGGYGGTALQFLRRNPGARYVIVDIPETLYVAWAWLDSAGIDVGWWDTDAQVRLLPSVDLEKFADPFDLAFAAHSLSEMPRPVVERYVGWVMARRPRYFYHDNAHRRPTPGAVKLTSQWFPETLASEFPVSPGYREVCRAPTIWAGSGERYWEFLYERIA